jgi:hypothetical protein
VREQLKRKREYRGAAAEYEQLQKHEQQHTYGQRVQQVWLLMQRREHRKRRQQQ